MASGRPNIDRRTVLKSAFTAGFGSSLISSATRATAADDDELDPGTWRYDCYKVDESVVSYFEVNAPVGEEWAARHRVIDQATGEIEVETVGESTGILQLFVCGTDCELNQEDLVFRYELAESRSLLEAGETFFEATCDPLIEVTIDIRPGSDRNPVVPDGRNTVPVAVLHTDAFDPARIDVETVRFGAPRVVDAGGGAREPHDRTHAEDVDGDGDTDVVFHFPIEDTGFDTGDTIGKLVGQTTDGTSIVGTDTIDVVGS